MQLDLFPPAVSANIYFAMKPAEPVAARMLAAARAVVPARGGRLAFRRLDLLHLTLRMVGRFDGPARGQVRQAMHAAARIALPPFEVRPDSVLTLKGGRPGRYPLVMVPRRAPDELRELWRWLGRELAAAGAGRHGGRAFFPHVTVRYGSETMPPTMVEAVVWPVSEFVLVRSVIGASRHEILGRWSLAG